MPSVDFRSYPCIFVMPYCSLCIYCFCRTVILMTLELYYYRILFLFSIILWSTAGDECRSVVCRLPSNLYHPLSMFGRVVCRLPPNYLYQAVSNGDGIYARFPCDYQPCLHILQTVSRLLHNLLILIKFCSLSLVRLLLSLTRVFNALRPIFICCRS